MDERIIAIYCLCDDLLIAQNHPQDPQSKISDAEVMTTAIVAAVDFRANSPTISNCRQVRRETLRKPDPFSKYTTTSRT
jgi:hypothetical protein